MKRIAAVFCFLLSVSANAQTAQPVVPGYMTTTGCPGSQPSCFVPYGAGIPVTPGSYSIVPLDVSTVTTGGTAVTALTAGHRTKGGWLLNPKGATQDLCISETGTASGTTSAGSLTCIAPGQTYELSASSAAVSVVSSDSSHPFAGQGRN